MTDIIKFSDVPDNHWAIGSIIFAAENEYMTGYPDNTFKPNQNLTRAEFAAALHRYHINMHKEQISDLVAEVKKSVVVIKATFTNDAGERRSSIGTGTFINADNQILTNYHCVSNTENGEPVSFEIGVLEKSKSLTSEVIKYYEGELLHKDSWEDIAVVKIKDNNLNYPYMPILKEPLKEGHDVISYGHGGGYLYAVGGGLIAQDMRLVGIWGMGQTDATINPGNSGGLISSIHKKAIAGVPSRKATQFDNISFYIPIQLIKRTLDNWNVEYEIV